MLRNLILVILMFVSLSSNAAIITNPSGKITIDFIYDYQCPYCHNMYKNIIDAGSQHNVKIRWLPVAIINNPLSLQEAALAIASTRYPNGFKNYQMYTMSGGSVLSSFEVASLQKQFEINYPGIAWQSHQQWVKLQLDESSQAMFSIGTRAVPITIIYPTNNSSKKVILNGEQSVSTIKEAINEISETP